MKKFNEIKIVTKPNCPACESVKNFVFVEKPEIFESVEVLVMHEDISLLELTTMIGYAPRSVPQVFVDGKHVSGGNTGLRKMVAGLNT